MKLTYRGISYEQPTSILRWSNGPVIGQYRGVPVRTQKVDRIPPQTPRQLNYRGLAYRVDRLGQIVNEQPGLIAAAAQPAIAERSPFLNAAQTHHSTMLASLERRIEIARVKGDQQLLTLLEAERQQMA
jgi:Domain of unknown function (DUF4278)